MEYPVKKLLIIKEGIEPEFFGDPVPGSYHVGYLIDYIEKNYPEDDAIHRWKASSEPNQIACALSHLKNSIICMNEVNEEKGVYVPLLVTILVPENMSEELEDKFRSMKPFFNKFKNVVGCTTKLESDNYGRRYLIDEQIDIDNRLSMDDKIEEIISKSKTNSNSKKV